MDISNKSKKYKTGNKLVYSCQYHVIFCPKYRRRVLSSKIQDRLKDIFMNISKESNFEILEQEILEDHVHLLISCNPKDGIYKIVSKLKGTSSNILRSEFKELSTRLPCLWSGSKFISSVGEVSLEVVKRYIEDQKGK